MSNSWKQYGGTSKTDKFHKFSVGTLIADEILLRQKYSGIFEFLGSINVAGDIIGKSNFIIKDANENLKVDLSTNLGIHTPTYMTNKVYFGTNTTDYFSGGANGIGINNVDPSGIFHIKARSQGNLGNTITTPDGIVYNDALVVSSDFINSSSLLTKNINRKGIRAVANTEGSAIEFFDNTNSDYRAAIQYNSTTGALSFGTDLLEFSDANQQLYKQDIYGKSLYNIRSGISLRLKSGYTTNNNANTFLTLNSANGRGLRMGGGIMPEIENSTNKEFGLMGLSDISGNLTEGIMVKTTGNKYKKRVNVGLNTYNPNDNYTMNVNGKVLLQYGEINTVETIPIQTYGVMKPDVGGTLAADASYNPPARIIRDDVVAGTMYLLSSPDAKKSISTKELGTGNYVYDIYKTLDYGENWTTIDGLPAALRNQTGVSKLFNLSLTTPIHYNNANNNNEQTFLFSAGRNRAYYYSRDGGANWYQFSAPTPNNVADTELFKTGQDTIYVDAWTNGNTVFNGNNLPNIVLFFITLNEAVNETTAHYFNVSKVSLNDFSITQGGGTYTLNNAFLTLNSTDAVGISGINNYTGYVEIPDAFSSSKSIGSYVYFLGTGMCVYNKSAFDTNIPRSNNTPENLTTSNDANSNKIGVEYSGITLAVVNSEGTNAIKYITNHNDTVNNVTYTVALGTNFIIYTTAANTTLAANWNILDIKEDLNLTYIPTMHHIHIVSNNEMYMVGDGLFLYNNSGIANITTAGKWKKVPDSLLNIGGSANAINNRISKLINIYKKDNENFYIMRALQDFDYKRSILNDQTEANTKLVEGTTNMYNVYIPTLLETEPQDIMDICGNVIVDGKMTINKHTKFNSDISSNGLFEANNVTINGLSVYNNDVSMNEHLFLLKDASFNNNINIINKTITTDLSVNNIANIKEAFVTDLSVNSGYIYDLSSNVAHINRLGVNTNTITETLERKYVMEIHGSIKGNGEPLHQF